MVSLKALGLATALLLPTLAAAEESIETEVKAAVEAYYAYTAEHLANPGDAISEEGSLQFWSSGGLVLSVDNDSVPVEYESFSVRPKHISVLPLSDTSAAVAYYAEGSMHPRGRAPVDHYLTRVLSVYVKEDGAWKIRAGHWSPLRGGGGTSQATD